MKALIISSLLFFSLRAMSGEVSEKLKSDCGAINSSPRSAKVVTTITSSTEVNKDKPAAVSK